jgi:hypothetical protein
VAKAYFSLIEVLCHNHMLLTPWLLPSLNVVPKPVACACFTSALLPLKEGGQGLLQPDRGAVPPHAAHAIAGCPLI